MSSFSPTFLPVEIVDIYPDVTWYAPRLRNGQFLAVPIDDGPNPRCIYFVKEISRNCEVVDYSQAYWEVIMKFKIEVGGRGGEVVIGTIQQEFYDFVYENEIDIEDYAINSDFLEENDQLDMPKSIQPFESGNWYECDNIAHEYGPSTEDVYISVLDESENIIHEALVIEQFLELGSTLNEVADYYIVSDLIQCGS